MKLIIFDKTNVETPARSGVRSINVNRSNGSITFSKAVQKDLNIKAGAYVIVAQDEESKNDWFINFSDSGNGFQLNQRKNSGWAKDCAPSLYFINKFVANKILDCVKAQKSASFLIGANPVKVDGRDWYKIVTAKPLVRNQQTK